MKKVLKQLIQDGYFKKAATYNPYNDKCLLQNAYFKDDILTGEYKSYYISGAKKEESFYVEGKLDGEYKHYDDGYAIPRDVILYSTGIFVKKVK